MEQMVQSDTASDRELFVADASNHLSDDDVDSDEPPSGKDLSETLDGVLRPAMSYRSPELRFAPLSPHRGLLPAPPIKPPPVR